MSYFSKIELDKEIFVMTEKERLEERLFNLNIRLKELKDENAPN